MTRNFSNAHYITSYFVLVAFVGNIVLIQFTLPGWFLQWFATLCCSWKRQCWCFPFAIFFFFFWKDYHYRHHHQCFVPLGHKRGLTTWIMYHWLITFTYKSMLRTNGEQFFDTRFHSGTILWIIEMIQHHHYHKTSLMARLTRCWLL